MAILMRCGLTWSSLALCILVSASPVRAERLKDLADLKGVRPNQLVGYGLVVGLGGTGDDPQAAVGVQSMVSMLKRLGAHVDSGRLRLPNVAAVVVTADLPAFVAPGQRLDVTVSSLGSAKSLEGGMLLVTPLKGADMQVYAVAQGPVSVGGFVAGGASGSKVAKNHTTVGRVPAGALVERRVEIQAATGVIEINLRTPDFTTATRMAKAIAALIEPKAPKRKKYKRKKVKEAIDKEPQDNPAEANKNASKIATEADAKEQTKEEATESKKDDKKYPPIEPLRVRALNGGTIRVPIPDAYRGKLPEFMAKLEALEVTPDLPTIVVINERTGTVILGEGVRLLPVAIAHGGLTVEVSETPLPSQPNAFGGGDTVVLPNTQIRAQETQGQLRQLAPGASLSEVIKALNALGLAPRDLVAILQALKSAGALRARLEIQ